MIWAIILVALLLILIRIRSRGYFWKDRAGNKLSFKEFRKRLGEGITEITPLQQTKTSLWSYLPLFSGLIWGIVVTFIAKTYWLTLILFGSFPITLMQFISNYQKYKSQKAAEDAFKEAMSEVENSLKIKQGVKNER